MPALKNHKHEWFAQELAKGKSQAEAYELAGYSPSEQHASRLARNGKVQARVSEIVARSAMKADVTVASLIAEAGEIQRLALEERQLSAASQALTIKAKLSGLWVDKQENTNRNVDPARVSDSELAEVIQSSGGAGITETQVDPSKLN